MKLLRRLNILYEKITGFDYSSKLTVKELGFTEEQANIYSPTPNDDLRLILNSLQIGPSDSILDLGAGKGAALAQMSRFPFKKIAGVEMSHKLCGIARQNLIRLGFVETVVYCSDAAEFNALDEYNYFYMFHPFPGKVLAKVLHNIYLSWQRSPRKITLIYYNPAFRDEIDKFPFFNLVGGQNTKYYETLIYEGR